MPSTTLAYGLRLLELLQISPAGMTSAEIQAQMPLSTSSLFSLLAELKNLGYIRQPERRGRYFAGLRMQFFSEGNTTGPQALLQSFESTIAGYEFELTLLLASRLGDNWLAEAVRQGTGRVVVTLKAGELLPITVAGQALLSAAPDPETLSKGYALETHQGYTALTVPLSGVDQRRQYVLMLLLPGTSPKEAELHEVAHELKKRAAQLSVLAGAPAYTPFEQYGRPAAARPLTGHELAAFLKGTWPASLACVRPDGSPHVIPVWQLWDGKGFTIPVIRGSQWLGYVRNNPHVSLTIDEPWPPYRRVICRGSAKIKMADGSAAQQRLLKRLAGSYLGQGQQASGLDISALVTIRPERLSGQTGL